VDDASCKCFGCALNRLLDERWPGPMSDDDVVEMMLVFGKIAGQVLGDTGPKTRARFIALLDHHAAERRAGRSPRRMH